jgi:hypothetical protein
VKARRSEGPKERLQSDQEACGPGKKTTAQTSAARVGEPRHSARTRTALMVQPC